jgi:hypothetical protein
VAEHCLEHRQQFALRRRVEVDRYHQGPAGVLEAVDLVVHLPHALRDVAERFDRQPERKQQGNDQHDQ